MKLNILYEDQEIIIVVKPAGVPSQSDKSMAPDMVSYLKNEIYQRTGKTNPYLAIVHRLDRGVSGVMVFAKTKEAAAVLSKQIQENEMNKRYVAVVSAGLEPMPQGEFIKLRDYLVKDGRTNLSRVALVGEKDAKEAILEYRVVDTKPIKEGQASLIDVKLYTGRHHQIRLQLREHVAGIWGDTKYNAQFKQVRGWNNIALSSYCLKFKHPKTKKDMKFISFPSGYPFDMFESERL